MEYASLRDKIAAEAAERDALHKRWQEGLAGAREHALEAAGGVTPQPMVVYEANGIVDDEPKPGGQSWYVSEGVCGFAWVSLYVERGGESRKFINWLGGKTKTNFPPPFGARKSYGGGFQIWIGEHGQSMQRKERHAESLAESIRALGIEGLRAYAGSRMD